MNLARVIVRGAGSIGRTHLRLLREIGAPALAFPARPDVTRLDLDPVASSMDEALAFNPDAVVIATATGRHVADAIEWLAHDCSLLIEKPLASTSDGAGRIAKAAMNRTQKVFVAFCLRFDTSLILFKQKLPEIGAVHAVRIECQSYLPQWRPQTDYRQSYSASATEGGVLRDLVHEIDYAMWLFGQPKTVFCTLENTGRLGIGAEEAADLSWTLVGGNTVSIRLDYLTSPAHRTMAAYGERGSLFWDGIAKHVRKQLTDGSQETYCQRQSRDEMLQAQLVAFLNAIHNHYDGSSLATLEEGAFAVSVCDAARTSARTRCIEKIKWSAT